MSDTIQSVKDLPEVSFIDNDTLEAMTLRANGSASQDKR